MSPTQDHYLKTTYKCVNPWGFTGNTCTLDQQTELGLFVLTWIELVCADNGGVGGGGSVGNSTDNL